MQTVPRDDEGSAQTEWTNRRAAARTDAEIEITFESDHNFFAGFSENISEGGVFLASYEPHGLGDRLNLKFTLPGEASPIETVAEVRWLRAYNPSSDTPPGYGLRFVDLDEHGRAAIERFVRQREPLFYDD